MTEKAIENRKRALMICGGHQPRKSVDPNNIVIPKPSSGILPKRRGCDITIYDDELKELLRSLIQWNCNE